MSKDRPPLEDMTLRQLRRVASDCGVSRYSRMRKDQLLAAIQEIQAQQAGGSAPPRDLPAQEVVEAAKFDVGQDDRTGGSLAAVDEGLPDLPAGYGECRIVLMPRDPQWAYTYWDIPNEAKENLRQQGGQQLALRIYDVTDVNLAFQAPHSIQEYPCDELAREWYLPIPVSDRDYVLDIGYRCADGRWLMLARSAQVRIPPIYPSDWIEDYFLTVSWDEELRGRNFATLTPPSKRVAPGTSIYDEMYSLADDAEAQRVAGSLYSSMQPVPGSIPAGSIQHVAGSMQHVAGSMQHVAGSIQHVPGSVQQSVSSYVLASGVGMWAVPGAQTMSGVGLTASGVGMTMSGVGLTASGVGMTMSGVGLTASGVGMTMSGVGLTASGVGLTASGVGMTMSGVGLTASGVGMTMSGVGLTASGVGMTMSGVGMSGVGFSASLPLVRPRKFWLIADAELIVYGATEPDATVTIGGRPIKLNPDGTFRFQMSFQDGFIDYPIMAVAADGEQMRSIHMKFNRETPERHTNTKEEAVEEWMV
ncbi:MAG: DUF4912 domain-containing protein [Leptolyngbyaceae cyanobacterium bins.349]|nr:DUF4912 domain-containing protein [Leptolyngbyaceae cyanobacterium bins.349]